MPLNSLPVEYLGTLKGTVTPDPVFIHGGPSGNRAVFTVVTCSFDGPRIKATMPEGVASGDWLTVRPDGVASLDIRLCLRTDDGADIYVTYLGYNIDGTLKVAPRFETGDERYAWMNSIFTIGIGAPEGDGVSLSYDFYIV